MAAQQQYPDPDPAPVCLRNEKRKQPKVLASCFASFFACVFMLVLVVVLVVIATHISSRIGTPTETTTIPSGTTYLFPLSGFFCDSIDLKQNIEAPFTLALVSQPPPFVLQETHSEIQYTLVEPYMSWCTYLHRGTNISFEACADHPHMFLALKGLDQYEAWVDDSGQERMKLLHSVWHKPINASCNSANRSVGTYSIDEDMLYYFVVFTTGFDDIKGKINISSSKYEYSVVGADLMLNCTLYSPCSLNVPFTVGYMAVVVISHSISCDFPMQPTVTLFYHQRVGGFCIITLVPLATAFIALVTFLFIFYKLRNRNKLENDEIRQPLINNAAAHPYVPED